jgi:hypothetical protein
MMPTPLGYFGPPSWSYLVVVPDAAMINIPTCTLILLGWKMFDLADVIAFHL